MTPKGGCCTGKKVSEVAVVGICGPITAESKSKNTTSHAKFSRGTSPGASAGQKTTNDGTGFGRYEGTKAHGGHGKATERKIHVGERSKKGTPIHDPSAGNSGMSNKCCKK